MQEGGRRTYQNSWQVAVIEIIVVLRATVVSYHSTRGQICWSQNYVIAAHRHH